MPDERLAMRAGPPPSPTSPHPSPLPCIFAISFCLVPTPRPLPCTPHLSPTPHHIPATPNPSCISHPDPCLAPCFAPSTPKPSLPLLRPLLPCTPTFAHRLTSCFNTWAVYTALVTWSTSMRLSSWLRSRHIRPHKMPGSSLSRCEQCELVWKSIVTNGARCTSFHTLLPLSPCTPVAVGCVEQNNARNMPARVCTRPRQILTHTLPPSTLSRPAEIPFGGLEQEDAGNIPGGPEGHRGACAPAVLRLPLGLCCPQGRLSHGGCAQVPFCCGQGGRQVAKAGSRMGRGSTRRGVWERCGKTLPRTWRVRNGMSILIGWMKQKGKGDMP